MKTNKQTLGLKILYSGTRGTLEIFSIISESLREIHASGLAVYTESWWERKPAGLLSGRPVQLMSG